MDDLRRNIYSLTKEKLNRIPLVESVELQGSMKSGLTDRFSDIDIQVTVQPDKDADVFSDLQDIMSFACPFLFTNVFRHLPNKYVANIWAPSLTKNSIYAWMDIKIVSYPHNTNITITDSPDSLDHLLRHFCQALKYTIRETDIAEDRRNQLLDNLGIKGRIDPKEDLYKALDAIHNLLEDEKYGAKFHTYTTYIENCHHEMKRNFG